MAEENLINLDHLKKISGNNTAFVREILSVFVQHTPEDLEQLRLQFEKSNLAQAQYFAHKLKSSTDSLGFKKGRDLFHEIEENLREKSNLEAVPGLIKEAIESCAKARGQAKASLEKGV